MKDGKIWQLLMDAIDKNNILHESHSGDFALALWHTFTGLESVQNTSSVPSMTFTTSLRISSARRALSLLRTLNCLRLIRCGNSSFHSLCRRWNRKFSLSKPKALAVIPRTTTSRSENLGTTPRIWGHFRVHSHNFQRNPCGFQGF